MQIIIIIINNNNNMKIKLRLLLQASWTQNGGALATEMKVKFIQSNSKTTRKDYFHVTILILCTSIILPKTQPQGIRPWQST